MNNKFYYEKEASPWFFFLAAILFFVFMVTAVNYFEVKESGYFGLTRNSVWVSESSSLIGPELANPNALDSQDQNLRRGWLPTGPGTGGHYDVNGNFVDRVVIND